MNVEEGLVGGRSSFDRSTSHLEKDQRAPSSPKLARRIAGAYHFIISNVWWVDDLFHCKLGIYVSHRDDVGGCRPPGDACTDIATSPLSSVLVVVLVAVVVENVKAAQEDYFTTSPLCLKNRRQHQPALKVVQSYVKLCMQ
eukprot:scaffold12210_cov136-Amphora_coffeaeformis.AAC.3